MALPPVKIIASMGVAKGQAFAAGWFEGVQRYKRNIGASGHISDLFDGSQFNPSAEPTSFAASEAALAYCLALEKSR